MIRSIIYEMSQIYLNHYNVDISVGSEVSSAYKYSVRFNKLFI